MYRSVTTELALEAGQYSVMIKITASRDKSRPTPEEIVKKTCQTRPDKLMAVGLSYDLAHAKGRLKESELERKERLRSERRDKRKMKAKKAFEAKKVLEKKEKLRRLRLEAKEKAKKSSESENDPDSDNGIEISIKMANSTLKPTKPQGANVTAGGSKLVSLNETSKQLKIIVEASDEVGTAKRDNQTSSGEIQQHLETIQQNLETARQHLESGNKQAEDVKQALKGIKDESENKQKIGDDVDINSISAAKSGQETEEKSPTPAIGVIPATSAESNSTAENSNKAEGQPSAKLDDNVVTSENVTNTETITKTGGNSDKSNAVESDVRFQKLTLDDISDDGLSWSSDIDVPSDSSSETDSNSDIDEPPPTTDLSQSSEKPADDFANDPWNAVCVFGLRVYSKGSEVEIEVIGKQDVGETIESKKLDVDDQAADATKKLQKGGPREEQELETVGTAPAWDEESKQG